MTAVDAARPGTRRLRPAIGAVFGLSLALVGNTIVFLVANALLEGSVQAPMGGTQPSDLPYVAVAATSVLPIIVGAGVLWLLSRFTGAALRVWTILAIAITLASLSAPLLLPLDFGSKSALALMHIVAAGSAIFGQHWAASRTARSRQKP